MSKLLKSAALPVLGGGEQSAAAPGAFEPPRAAFMTGGGGSGVAEVRVMENGIITGPGVVLQQPDWLTAYNTNDPGFTPVGVQIQTSSPDNVTTITVSNALSATPLDDAGLTNGVQAVIGGHSYAPLNGQWTITRTSATTFTIPARSIGGSFGTVYALPVQTRVVLGVFAFQQQGDQGTPTAGVAVVYDPTLQIAWLDQLDESLALQRRLILYSSYVPPVLPQISALEMFGKLYLCDYPNNSSATQRRGMAVFNPSGLLLTSSSAANPTVITVSNAASSTPLDDIGIVTGTQITIAGHSVGAVNGQWSVTRTGATTFTIPVASTGGGATGAIYIVIPRYALAGGTPAALRPRGISIHRGGSLILWGYGDENIPDQVHLLRWSKYTQPDNFTADTTETTPGKATIGTLNVPIIACGISGNYSVLGKQNEVYVMEGDYASQFNTSRQIGTSQGPISTVGLAAIPGAAAWMTESGPAMSEQGGNVQRLGIDKITRRFLNYLDLTTCSAAHDSYRQRVVWAMRRKLDDQGVPVDSVFATEQFVWDYARNQFYVASLPAPVFCLGVTKGPGTNLPSPTGVVSAIVASAITSSSVVLTWTPGDTHSDVSFNVQFRVHGQTTWITGGTTPAGTPSITLTGLGQNQQYDVRVQQTRNSRSSAWTESDALFTTLQVSITVDPSSVVASEYRDVQNPQDGTFSAFNHVRFNPYNDDPSLVVDLAYDRDTALDAGIFDCGDLTPGTCNIVASVPASSGLIDDPTEWTGLGRAGATAPRIYYQVRMRKPSNGAVSDWVPATPFPLIPTGRNAPS